MKNFINIEDIYPEEKRIYVNDSMLENLDERRRLKYTAEKSLINTQTTIIDINKMDTVPDGRLRINIDSARFECFFHRGNEKKLYLILDGARTHSGGKKREIPIFLRWSWYPFADYSWLSIEDPMYYKYEDLLLGWFFGDETHNYREYVAKIAEKFSEYLDIASKDIVFMGPSGGGTAAIHSAAIFGKGSTAISINGQINFEKQHKNIDDFKKHVGIDLYSYNDVYKRNDLCSVMKDAKNTNFVLVENCRSNWDFNDHVKYFCEKLNINPSYGISKFDNIYVYLYDAKGKIPHSSFEDKNTFFALDFLSKLASNQENIERYRSLYLLFNEFWYDAYDKPSLYQRDLNFLDTNFISVKTEKKYLIMKKENISIPSLDYRYNNWKYNNFSSNMVYHIEVSDISSTCNIKEFTCGVYDYHEKKFLKKDIHTINESPVCYDFVVGNNVGRIGFCIFSGKHGETQNIDLTIGNFEIYAIPCQ